MPDTVIRETIPQANAPTASVPVDLRKVYTSGGYNFWYGQNARSLGWAIDDLTLAFGDDLYARMVFESTLASATNIMKAGILSDGLSLTSAIEDKDDPDYEQAAEIVDWCERILADLIEYGPDIHDVLFNMLDALHFGNKVAELVYASDSTYTGKEQIVLQGVQVKSRRTLAFVVDPYKRLLGFLALQPGSPTIPITGIPIEDLAKEENFVPAEKFAVLTSRPEDNDPRGTSIFRAAYDPWHRKEKAKAQHEAYLARFAMASLVGFTPKDAQPVMRLDAANNPVLDSAGNPICDYPNDVMRDALLGFQNGTVLVLPDGSADGSKLQVIQPAGDGSPFLQAFSLHDREMIKAILTVTLATGEGEHASRAQAGVHQDAQDTLIGHAKRGVTGMVRSQILRRMIGYNYGPSARKFTPRVSLGSTEPEDLAKIWTALAALATSGYIDESQKPQIDSRVNLPERVLVDTVDQGDGDTAAVDPQDPAPAPGAPGTPAPSDPAPTVTPPTKPAPAARKAPVKARPVQQKGTRNARL